MKNLMKLLKKVTPKNYPKYEINYIYYNSTNKELVTTDAYSLIKIKDIDLGDKDLFGDIHGIVDNAEPKRVVGSVNFYEVNENFKYPKYDRIIPDVNKLHLVEIPEILNNKNLFDVLCNAQSILGNCFYIEPTKLKAYELIKSHKDTKLSLTHNIYCSSTIEFKNEKYNVEIVYMYKET